MEHYSLDELHLFLKNLRRPIIAISGGLDSSLLALLLFEAKGSEMLSLTALTSSLSSRDRMSVMKFVAQHTIPHTFIETSEFKDEHYLSNDKDRCYHCKRHLFSAMKKFAEEFSYQEILYGAQKDDLDDYRPGNIAAEEASVIAPFIIAGWGKSEIRAEARRRGLDIAEKPASPCLASRIEYGISVSEERLRRIEKAEELLYAKGLNIFRVRDRGNYATIELGKDEMKINLDREKIIEEIKLLGFEEVSFDPRGYRKGSLNEF